MLEPPKPTPIKHRLSFLFIERGELNALDGAFVMVDSVNGTRTHIPVGSVTCLLLEPGTRVSHAAVALAARVGCLLIWVGEAGVRMYAVGQPGGARADRLLYQAKIALDEKARLEVVRKMYAMRFGEDAPERRSIDQLRGIEGARVKKLYELLAQQYRVPWKGRRYDPKDWEKGDLPNRCLSAATAALYGVSEAAILAAGYSPAIGFLHTGKPRSFVYDIADVYKFEVVVPTAFQVAAKNPSNPESEVRRACRDAIRVSRMMHRLIPTIDEILSASGLTPPPLLLDGIPPAIPLEQSGDVGHRS